MAPVLLIGGTSHSGKTTLGSAVAERLGRPLCSTDYLARHPGRPWRDDGTAVPPHVTEHFTTLSLDDLVSDVIRHYRSVWPQVESLIRESPDGIVVEGSAVLPDLVASLDSMAAKAVWLICEDGTFKDRIYRASNFDAKSGIARAAIEMFALQAEQFNRVLREEVQRLEFVSIPAEGELDWQVDEVMGLLG